MIHKADEALKTLQQEYHEKEKLLTNIAASSDIDIDDILVKKELLQLQEELVELNNIWTSIASRQQPEEDKDVGDARV